MSGRMRKRERRRPASMPTGGAGGFHKRQKDPRYTTPDIELLHGRAVGRLRRLSGRAEVTGLPDARFRRMAEAVKDIIVFERLGELDDVGRAAAWRDPWQHRVYFDVSDEQVLERIGRMSPGAGLVLP